MVHIVRTEFVYRKISLFVRNDKNRTLLKIITFLFHETVRLTDTSVRTCTLSALEEFLPHQSTFPDQKGCGKVQLNTFFKKKKLTFKQPRNRKMKNLLKEIRNCRICFDHLPHGVNPVLAAHRKSKIAVIGQAPGSIVHKTGIPWDDQSGDRLREWLGVSKSVFYDSERIALVPVGFCYPGKGSSGDLPPRKECAPAWHEKLFEQMKDIRLTLLIGSYAQNYYLRDKLLPTLTQTVKHFSDYLPDYFVLPHPSPRNNIWLKRNPWFENELLPQLKDKINAALLT